MLAFKPELSSTYFLMLSDVASLVALAPVIVSLSITSASFAKVTPPSFTAIAPPISVMLLPSTASDWLKVAPLIT